MQETQVWSQVARVPWRRAWQPTPVFLPGEFGQRSLVGYSPWGRKELDTTQVRAQKMQAARSSAPRGLPWRRKFLKLYRLDEAPGWPRGMPVRSCAIKYLNGLKKLMHLSNCLQEKKRIMAWNNWVEHRTPLAPPTQAAETSLSPAL